jgi:hypothetical protein
MVWAQCEQVQTSSSARAPDDGGTPFLYDGHAWARVVNSIEVRRSQLGQCAA